MVWAMGHPGKVLIGIRSYLEAMRTALHRIAADGIPIQYRTNTREGGGMVEVLVLLWQPGKISSI